MVILIEQKPADRTTIFGENQIALETSRIDAEGLTTFATMFRRSSRL